MVNGRSRRAREPRKVCQRHALAIAQEESSKNPSLGLRPEEWQKRWRFCFHKLNYRLRFMNYQQRSRTQGSRPGGPPIQGVGRGRGASAHEQLRGGRDGHAPSVGPDAGASQETRRIVKARGTQKSRNSLCPCGHGATGPSASRASSVPSNPTGPSGSALRYEPFVGLWSLPRYPAAADSCTNRPQSTGTPGWPYGFPRAAHLRVPWWYMPFVGLWSLPSCPAGARGCTFPSPRQAHRVGLTAFPGLPIRVPQMILRTARDSAQSKRRSEGSSIPKRLISSRPLRFVRDLSFCEDKS